jgi:hypothetical protein
MPRIQRNRIGTLVLVCIAVGLFAAAFLLYSDHARTDWWSYSFWARRWIMFTGAIIVGIVGRLMYPRHKRRGEKNTDHDAAQKT